MPGPRLFLARLRDRFGLVPRLVAATLLAVAVAVGAVSAVAVNQIRADLHDDAESRLDMSMAVLKEALRPLGTEWRQEGDRLTLGGQPLNDRNDVVDAVRRTTGAVATIFLGDLRIATNVTRPDGARGTGTRLAAGPVHDKVIRGGATYRGEAQILGQPYITIYEPIRDAGGRQLGILFVGVTVAQQQAEIQGVMLRFAAGAGIVLLVVAIGAWLVLRASLRPLGELAGALNAIGAGEMAVQVPARRAATSWATSAAPC
jgi:methyl-accepting chemotaxis protein